jgi:small neutral amino acid transporter SnatA (MarC family)
MTLRTVLFVVVAVDPFGASVVLSRMRERREAGAVAVVGAGVLLALACAFGPSLLDGLDISAEAAEITATSSSCSVTRPVGGGAGSSR